MESTGGFMINSAKEQELFESLFADTGSREQIRVGDWVSGWSAIVGGINGIPTSRQFNTLQYITDLKCLLLYQAVITLKQAGTKGILIGPPQKLGANMVLFETIKGSNRIVKIRQTDAKGNESVYDLAAVFQMAQKRENIQSGDTLSVLFGKIMRYLKDLKPNCFTDADDAFVLMTEATYKQPSLRTEGSLYGLITDKRGLIIIFFDRYVTGMENPTVQMTLYGVETMTRSAVESDGNAYKAILKNVVHVKDGQEVSRKRYMLYAVTRTYRLED